MSTYIICTRCGRPMRPVYSDGTSAPTNGYCQCAPATSWGDVPLIDWRDSELLRLRMQVEQTRIDAIKDREAFAAKLVIEADTLRADLAEARADVARFEAALDVANRELEEARRERDEARKWAKAWKASAKEWWLEERDTRKCNFRIANQCETLKNRWQSESAFDALDGVLEAATDGIAEYEAMYQGRRQEYIDTIRKDISTVRAALGAARMDGPLGYPESKSDSSRRTIRALVVAARAIHRTLWSALDQYEVNNEGIEREMRQHVIGLRWEMQQADRQAGKE